MLEIIVYWGVWLIIPILLEGVGAVSNMAYAMYYRLQQGRLVRGPGNVEKAPLVSILLPCRNAAATLYPCLASIQKQTYLRTGSIEVLVLDNGSTDETGQVYQRFTVESPFHRNLRLKYAKMATGGKAKALNYGIFDSDGEIVVTMDSDTEMDPESIEVLVQHYQRGKKDIAAIGGCVLIDYRKIAAGGFVKFLQLAEMYEYLEAFFVGRVSGSITRRIYTLAGAFSSFRRYNLNQTRLFHPDSLAEDTFLTFEIKKTGRVVFEPRAIVFTEPVSGISNLASQRFRWQRGQMEIAFRYKALHRGWLKDILTNHLAMTLFTDHTLVFSRTVWLFVMVLLYFWGYPGKLLLMSNLGMYGLYILVDILYLVPILLMLRNRGYRFFLLRHLYVILFMPLYRFLTYILRLQGIIDGILKEPQWKAKTLGEEIQGMLRTINQKLMLSWVYYRKKRQ